MLGCESDATALASQLEAGEGVHVLGERFGQHLDSDLTIEAGIAGAVHLAHAAGAELGQDVRRDPGGSLRSCRHGGRASLQQEG